MRNVAHSNPHARVLMRALKFSSGATWHVTQPIPVEQFQWPDLEAGGVTDMGRALLMVAEELKIPPMDPRGLPPVLVLISDGHPTDDVSKGISAIMEQPWGKKAVRIAIGIGHDADHNVLRRFINHPEIQPLQANNAEQLVHYIKWASTAVLQSSSSPAVTDTSTHNGSGLHIPVPAPTNTMPIDSDVW
ncbi:hypothetical protein KSZ_02780 [Dictyobacter formicarum]|uniref:VWFA domain-containing protein n=2 Tax=Dictyobacter formicarum TaxID=2778368 RepID=A0ABQ3V822_9CHLR|nr:hypothetical protein KSZ_02780 [Dictyobacter formicarum]